MKTGSPSRIFLGLSAFLAALSISLHFLWLSEVPPGFFVDEASVAYNAFCLDTAGVDEHGERLPLLFKCFGQYQDPVPIYSAALCGLFAEITRPLARAPIAAFHILAAVAFFFLARKYVRNEYLALAGAFAFSCVPWLFPISRMAMMGHLPMLLGICAGWLFLMKAFSGKGNSAYAALSACFWAFSAYSHNSGRPFAAIFLIAFVALFNKALIKRWRALLAFCVTLGLLSLPLACALWAAPDALLHRLNDVNAWKDNPGFLEAAIRVASNYAGYFDPRFLFLQGDPEIQHHTGVCGELYVCIAPFALCGVYSLLRSLRRRPWNCLALVALLGYPVAAALTEGGWHSTRSALGALAWCLASTIGLSFVCARLKRRPGILKPVLAAAAVAFLAEASIYLHDYFTAYKARCAAEFMSPLADAIECAYASRPGGGGILVSANPSAYGAAKGLKPSMYIFGLFFSKTGPREYLKRHSVPDSIVRQYDGKLAAGDILLRQNPLCAETPEGFILVKENPVPPPPGAILVKSFTGADFSAALLKGRLKVFRNGAMVAAQGAALKEFELKEGYEVYRASSSQPLH